MSNTEGEGLLSRWSRRKLEAREQPQPVDGMPESEDKAELPVVDEKLEVVEEPVLTDDDMPPIESLSEDSDYSLFMSPGVSDKLRNLALRKMFHVPAFNIRDGLDEYDEDYTYFEALGDIVTCDMKHQIEMQEKKKKEQQEAEALAGEHGVDEEAIEEIDKLAADDEDSDEQDDDTGLEQVENSQDKGEAMLHE